MRAHISRGARSGCVSVRGKQMNPHHQSPTWTTRHRSWLVVSSWSMCHRMFPAPRYASQPTSRPYRVHFVSLSDDQRTTEALLSSPRPGVSCQRPSEVSDSRSSKVPFFAGQQSRLCLAHIVLELVSPNDLSTHQPSQTFWSARGTPPQLTSPWCQLLLANATHLPTPKNPRLQVPISKR